MCMKVRKHQHLELKRIQVVESLETYADLLQLLIDTYNKRDQSIKSHSNDEVILSLLSHLIHAAYEPAKANQIIADVAEKFGLNLRKPQAKNRETT